MKIKPIFLILYCFVAVFLTGCTSIFIHKDEPMVVADSDDALATIVSYGFLTTGIVEDISSDGNQLLLLSGSPYHNISLLNLTDSGKLISLINSDKTEENAVFSMDQKNIFYIESTEKDTENNKQYQLFSSTLDKSSVVAISASDEDIDPVFCLNGNGVIYSYERTFVFADPISEEQTKYTLDNDYMIHQLFYDSETHILFFLANASSEESTMTNLYAIDFEDQSSSKTITPALLATNIVDFEYQGSLYYIQSRNNSRTIIKAELSGTKISVTHELYSGNLASLKSTSDSNILLFTKYLDQNNQSLRSIWTLNIQTEEAKQLTSPQVLDSKIITNPNQNILYFSVEDPPVNGIPISNIMRVEYKTE